MKIAGVIHRHCCNVQIYLLQKDDDLAGVVAVAGHLLGRPRVKHTVFADISFTLYVVCFTLSNICFKLECFVVVQKSKLQKQSNGVWLQLVAC